MNGPATHSPSILDRLRKRSLGAGIFFALVLVAGALIDSRHFYPAYLTGYIYWLSISLGCLALTMVHHLTGGGWGFVIRRQLEAGARIIPVMGLLFIPVLLGMDTLFPWMHDGGAHAEIISHKQAYLNPSFFILRAVLYFLIWGGMAVLLNRWSKQQDKTGGPDLTVKMRTLSGPGIVLYGLTATFASVDWIMSLEPEWFSTIYGLIFMVSHALAAFALVTILTRRLSGAAPLSEVIHSRYFHNLGNWLLAFVMLWGYLSFSQFLLIWSANLPEEVSWYVHRTGRGWQVLAAVLIVCHFIIPFLVLLSRRTKQHAASLVKVAVWILVIRYLDFFWWIKPAFEGFSLHWLDVAAPLAIGGIWLALFARELGRHSLVPTQDPRLEEAFGESEALHHG